MSSTKIEANIHISEETIDHAVALADISMKVETFMIEQMALYDIVRDYYGEGRKEITGDTKDGYLRQLQLLSSDLGVISQQLQEIVVKMLDTDEEIAKQLQANFEAAMEEMVTENLENSPATMNLVREEVIDG